jgi:hypothetical protein
LDLGLGAGSDAGKDAGVGEDGVKGGGELGGQREVIVDGLVEIDESRLKIRRQTNRVSKMLRRQAKGTSRRESSYMTPHLLNGKIDSRILGRHDWRLERQNYLLNLLRLRLPLPLVAPWLPLQTTQIRDLRQTDQQLNRQREVHAQRPRIEPRFLLSWEGERARARDDELVRDGSVVDADGGDDFEPDERAEVDDGDGVEEGKVDDRGGTDLLGDELLAEEEEDVSESTAPMLYLKGKEKKEVKVRYIRLHAGIATRA